jgi:AmmeMemoRadiSam system protein B
MHLQAVASGDPAALLAAAARTRNSMCGLAPLAVALAVARRQAWGRPQLLSYAPAHLISSRADSTGFAAHVACG